MPYRMGNLLQPPPSPIHTSDSEDTLVNKVRSRAVVRRFAIRLRRRARQRSRRRLFGIYRLRPQALVGPDAVWHNILQFL